MHYVGPGFPTRRGTSWNGHFKTCPRSIFSTLFATWQQRCGLLLSVQQRLVYNVYNRFTYTGWAKRVRSQTRGHNSVKSRRLEPVFLAPYVQKHKGSTVSLSVCFLRERVGAVSSICCADVEERCLRASRASERTLPLLTRVLSSCSCDYAYRAVPLLVAVSVTS